VRPVRAVEETAAQTQSALSAVAAGQVYGVGVSSTCVCCFNAFGLIGPISSVVSGGFARPILGTRNWHAGERDGRQE